MGLSSSKTKTKTEQNTTGSEQTSGTTQPLMPDWLSGIGQDYFDRIGAMGDMDPNQFVAPASPLQNMAFDNVGALSGWQGQARTGAQMAQAAGQAGPFLAGRPQVAQAPKGTGGQMQAPSLVSGQGYSAPGPAYGYAAARTGAPIGANPVGYEAGQMHVANIDPTTNASASNGTAGNIAGNMSQFLNPYTSQVVDASLADFDQGGAQQQARLAAAGARNGAFGGSRFGIAEGQLGADLARGRAGLSAGLRSDAFNTAAGLGAQQAGMDQGASLFNAQNQTGVSLANAGAANNRALSQASLLQQGDLANLDSRNQANQFGANATNAANMFNASNANQFAQNDAARQDAAGQFNASQNNNMSQFNAQQGDQAQARALQAAQLLQSGAGQYAGDTRADLGTMAALGDQQRQIEQGYAMSPMAQLQMMGQLGQFPFGAFVGQQINGNSNTTGTMQGTNVTSQSPSLFNQLLTAGQFAAQFI